MMGLCQSEEERRQQHESRQIDQRLKEAHKAEKNVLKLLLLGTGECGKTTLIKQMRILHSNGFTQAELMQRRSDIYSNIVIAMTEILRGMRNCKIAFGDPQRENDAQVVLQTLERCAFGGHEPFDAALADALKRLWSDPGLNPTAYSRRLEYNLHESAKYFLDSLERILDASYCPTYEDILLVRQRTTGITVLEFEVKGVQLRVVDVGGQRSERKKWIHCFEGVNGVIYISAVSEYNQLLAEDLKTNRLLESMRLFEAICNSRWFINTPIILFLNKKDLFEEKIRLGLSIKTCFPSYDGLQTYEDSMEYIRKEFEKQNVNPNKSIYVHQTCATSAQVHLILDSAISMIVQSNLQRFAMN